MQTQITGRKVEVTPAIRTYIEEKIKKLSRHFNNITQTHIILSVDHARQRAEATIHIPGFELFAESEEKDMYAAVDLLVDKLDRQIVKHKEKMKEHKA